MQYQSPALSRQLSRSRCSHRVCLALLCCLAWDAAFVSSCAPWRRSVGVAANAQAGPKKATAQEPWKPLVFKMPQRKLPRKLEPGDDGFTVKMRDRLKAVKAKEGDEPDDLISVSTENAKNLALSALWRIEQEADRKKSEKENPDVEVLRNRYEGAMERLQLPEQAPAEPVREEETTGVGKVQIGRSMDELFENAPPVRHGKVTKIVQEAPTDEEAEEEGVADYLATLQRRSLQRKRRDKKWLKKRIVRSPEDRRKDYEDTKVRLLGYTAALGGLGTAYAYSMLSASVAFSFGLGAIGSMAYVSGLASYTDNAENPMGTALGSRRLLTPLIVLLVVQGWPRIEAQVPQLAELHLEPTLFPAILGFFIYSIGKVLAGLLQ